jgi:hypothetical protein
VKINVTFKAIQYKFITKNLTYNNEDLIFKLDGDYSLFDKIYINGEELQKENYTVKEGSTIIILSKNYLETLKEGNYEIKVSYKTGVEPTSKFTIKKNNIDEKVKNPNTGDKIYMYLSLLIVSCLMFFIIFAIEKKSKDYHK